MNDAREQVLARWHAPNWHPPHEAHYLADLIRTPSFSSKEAKVIQVIKKEMQKVGFDQVRIDGLGNVIGRIGHGLRPLASRNPASRYSACRRCGSATGWTSKPNASSKSAATNNFAGQFQAGGTGETAGEFGMRGL